LRAAIEEANATGGTDTINFNIEGGSGVKTIEPTKALPAITDTVVIDGYSQPGARPNTQAVGTNAVLKIELDGTNTGAGVNGLRIQASKTVIKGLVINRFSSGGIHVIRGTSIAIQGNFIGTDPGGTVDLGNRYNGVLVLGNDPDSSFTNTTIGGTAPAARNLISGNDVCGVRIVEGATGNKVQGNYIGTDASGAQDLGNTRSGVHIDFASNNTVGGTVSAARNIISGNGGDGVQILGNASIDSATDNRILGNSIFSNTNLGIDLGGDGRTANDPQDPDKGPNNLQNFPVLTSATTSTDSTTIRGTLDSTPNTTFTVQFFRNPAGTDEGKMFIGQKKSVTTDASGGTTFTFRPDRKVNVGLAITATATDPAGNTSEFSDPATVT